MFVDPEINPGSLPPLVLAYVGDAVFELFVRTKLVASPAKLHKLHKTAVKYVQAGSQAQIVHYLEPKLTEAEKEVVRRGRNAKGGAPRHGDVVEYRYSTGFEALIGYLYLSGQEGRLLELLEGIDPTTEL